MMIDAVAYGYAPLEIIWQAKGGRWSIGNIVGKPPRWFEFDQDNKLVFKSGVTGTEPLPENRFLVVRIDPCMPIRMGIKCLVNVFGHVRSREMVFAGGQCLWRNTEARFYTACIRVLQKSDE
ncbi:MAG: DUF935 domain-containing protein [Treponema sp.]|nr:DUF935 domain-containing protein [Treponema sp.]